MALYPNQYYTDPEDSYNPADYGIASVAPQTTTTAAPTAPLPTGTSSYADILQYINSLQATQVDPTVGWNPNTDSPQMFAGGSDPRNINWGAIPDLAQFYTYDQQNNQEGVSGGLVPYMQENGYRWMQGRDPASETIVNWIVGPDGKPIAESARLTGTNDENFSIAAKLAQAVVGGAVGGWASAGNNPMGGVPITSTVTPPPVDVGGLSGWDAAMVDAAKSGAITPEWMAGAITQPWDLPMDDPNWQPNPADYGSLPSGSVPGATTPSVTVTAPPISTLPGAAAGAGIGALPGVVDTFVGPGEQTVEVEGKRIPQEDPDGYYYPGDPYYDSLDNNPTNNTDNNPDYSNEPIEQNPPTDNNPDYGNEPVEPRPTPPTSGSNPFLDWIKANPKLAISLLGPLLGEIGGGGNTTTPPGAGGPGTGPQAGMTATPAASLGRQYIPPPPGYRPGFDPEHRYFTGIGAVGTTPAQPAVPIVDGTKQIPVTPAPGTTV